MGVGIYYFYHGFGLKAFEGRHIRIVHITWLFYIDTNVLFLMVGDHRWEL